MAHDTPTNMVLTPVALLPAAAPALEAPPSSALQGQLQAVNDALAALQQQYHELQQQHQALQDRSAGRDRAYARVRATHEALLADLQRPAAPALPATLPECHDRLPR